MGACKPERNTSLIDAAAPRPPKCLMILSQMNPYVPSGNSGTLLARGKNPVYAFGILPADGQGMGLQRHWVLVLPDPLAGLPEEGTNADGELPCAIGWEVRVCYSRLEEVFRM